MFKKSLPLEVLDVSPGSLGGPFCVFPQHLCVFLTELYSNDKCISLYSAVNPKLLEKSVAMSFSFLRPRHLAEYLG